MSLGRRQFLVLLGSVGGLGASTLVHRFRADRSTSELAASPSVPASPPSASPQATPTSNVLQQAGLMNPPRGDARIVVISDLNGEYGSTTYDAEVRRAIELVPEWQPDIVLAGGDMVAGQSKNLSRSQIQAMWAGFDRAVAAPLRQANLPFGFTIGNHDASRAIGPNGAIYQQEIELAAAYWNDPAHDPGLEFVDRYKFPFYYTFREGELFGLVWDASSSLRMPADELAWVERSLASNAAQTARLRLVIGHLPLYAVGVNRDRPGEVLGDADELRALLERHRVHTYISGHHHAYYPGHRGTLEMLHAGALGGGPRQLLNSPLPPRKTITVVDVTLSSASTVYTTFDMQAMRLIDQQELPRLVVGNNGVVFRRDVNWSDLSPQEQATCIQAHSAAVCQA
ncbi:metallophosphoesterase [Oculatella sp. LEGE 06141]|uniref:metallophosphoesterase family protein n=1 Tax=Oculatella sp. LEGE 06141 TaxID=1828648 RepID=UPI001882334B|nr:metallophosphoesterase [Oculatella sp. LEGE 06141]MBE9182000.1 metallophosphoesterase [Oculatella sp. LEGE 06141]